MADDEIGCVLHNLETREDVYTFTEAEALAHTESFGEYENWSLWKVRRDGRSKPAMVAVAAGQRERGSADLLRSPGGAPTSAVMR